MWEIFIVDVKFGNPNGSKNTEEAKISATLSYSLHELAHISSAFPLKLFLGSLGFLSMGLG